jgi:hypothetical protein
MAWRMSRSELDNCGSRCCNTHPPYPMEVVPVDSNLVIVILIGWVVVGSIFGAGFLFGAALGKSKVEDELAEIMLAEELRGS